MYDVLTVADTILKIAKSKGKALTPMQLVKLTYIAHGWSLALSERDLFKNRIEAWRYGPVIPDLYQATKNFGRSEIPLERVGTPDDKTFPHEFPYLQPASVQPDNTNLVGLFVTYQHFSFDTVGLDRLYETSFNPKIV